MEDFEAIKEKFKRVIQYSQSISDPKINDLFDRWAKAKAPYMKLFGDSLIYEYPEMVTFDLGDKEREFRVEDFILNVCNHWDNYRLSQFIQDNKEGFFTNQVVKPMTLRDGTKIPKGMKLVRAFKYFEMDKDVLYRIQNAASMIIQENKICGKLCLSVHPLDFLSSSENSYNWRSCHSLDGEYRAGNLSYMVDESTIICYLKSPENGKILNFPADVPWTDKKWRMLIHFSNDWNMMFAGRQYPFASTFAPEFVLENLITPLFKTSDCESWSSWTDFKIKEVHDNGIEYKLFDKYLPVGGHLIALGDLVKEGAGALNYNDILYSSCYDPMYSFRNTKWFKTGFGSTNANTKFVIGGRVKCLDCGQDYISLSETMRCNCCEEDHGDLDTDNFGYCSCCGRHIYMDDAYWVGDDYLCVHCYEEQCSTCDECGESFYNEDLIYDRESGQTLCKYCYDYRRENEEEE